MIELYYKHTPRTCYNLAALAHAGYYDDTVVHRVTSDVVQCGDPTGTGRGGESIYGGTFEDEISRNLKHTGAGVVSMANSGTPHTNKSQFFITLKPTPYLDMKHTIFGRVYSGMSIVQRMGLVPTDPNNNDRPIHTITIYKARPYRGPPPASSSNEISLDVDN